MTAISAIARKFQFVECVLPRRLRLPARYLGQRLVGGLEPEMALLGTLVTPGGIALDIGANHGVYAYALAGIAESVICFEPLEECCRYIEAFNAPRIFVHNCALSDRPGTLELHIPLINGKPVATRASLARPSGPSEMRRIDVRTLDSFLLPKVDFIKMDVEGLEASVLRGAWRTVQKHRPAMLIEIDCTRHTQNSFNAIFAMLQQLEYAPHVCTDGKLSRCNDAWREAATHINFIFLQSGEPMRAPA